MKKKKIIALGLVVLLGAAVLLVIYFWEEERQVLVGAGRITGLNCAKEGEAITDITSMNCCAGLKPVGGWPGGYNGDCGLMPPPTGLSMCVNCGNGACDTYNGENKCNCPEDCK